MRFVRRRLAIVAFFGLVAAALAGAFAACKQGENEYCQVDNNCQSGLICVKGTNRCQGASTDDSASPDDAAVDAFEGDAPLDAPVDAVSVDAPDASVN